MGTWGVAIFSNDTSSDVRDEFRDGIGDGEDAATVTLRLVEEFRPDEEPECAADFWLALALTQHRLGRLTADVLTASLAVIDSGADLERWAERDRPARQRTLARARLTLTSPQPAPRRVKRRIRVSTELTPGAHVLYRLASGRRILLRITRRCTDRGGRT